MICLFLEEAHETIVMALPPIQETDDEEIAIGNEGQNEEHADHADNDTSDVGGEASVDDGGQADSESDAGKSRILQCL